MNATPQDNGDEPKARSVLSVDPSALDFYFDALLPDVSEHIRRDIRAAIMRGIEAREREAELRGKISVMKNYQSIAPDEVPARLAALEQALQQLTHPKPQAGDGEGTS